jgi:5-methylcytosine-specific restriction endonuclease McrA
LLLGDYVTNRPKGWANGSTTKWRKARAHYLAQHPLCQECMRRNRTAAATIVDHITPIADGGSMWNRSNWQALCQACSDAKTAAENTKRRTGRTVPRKGCDAAGLPLDPTHPWRKL